MLVFIINAKLFQKAILLMSIPKRTKTFPLIHILGNNQPYQTLILSLYWELNELSGLYVYVCVYLHILATRIIKENR